MFDLSDEVLAAARERIDHNLARQVARGKLSEVDMTAALSRISTGTDYAALGDCDLVIEAATENEEIKREIFKRLVPHLGPDALVATNTSSISITRLAARSEEHTSELQSLMRISYAVFCL